MTRLLPFLILLLLGGALSLGLPSGDSEPDVAPTAAVVQRELVSTPTAAHEQVAPNDRDGAQAAFDARRAWLEKNDRALVLLGEEGFAEAVGLFEECIEAAPDEVVLSRNLAEALIRWSRFEHDVERVYESAISHLERAIELAPEREDIENLRAILDRWKRELVVEEGFWTDSSPYFELVYDAGREDLRTGGQLVLNELHAAYGDLRDWFVVDPVIELGRPKFRAVLYDAKGFDQLTGLGHWAGGVFDGVLRLRVDDLNTRRNWQGTLRHELVHAFIREVGGRNVPSWFNEGLAQLLDRAPARVDSQRLRHPRTLLRQRLRDGGQLFTLDALHRSLATWKDTSEISAGYAQSLLLTAVVLESYGEHTVRQLLRATREGLSFGEAFKRETGVDAHFLVDDLSAELLR